jgi:hypothetical protein
MLTPDAATWSMFTDAHIRVIRNDDGQWGIDIAGHWFQDDMTAQEAREIAFDIRTRLTDLLQSFHAQAVAARSVAEPLLCQRCERAIDVQEQGGYVEQVALGRVRVPYHRHCWDENEHALDHIGETNEMVAQTVQQAVEKERDRMVIAWENGIRHIQDAQLLKVAQAVIDTFRARGPQGA